MVERQSYGKLSLAEVELLCGTVPQRLPHKPLTALAAKIKTPLLIGVVVGKLTVGVELFKSFQDFVDVSKIVAIIIHCGIGLRGGRVHFHSYHVARIVFGIELAFAHVAAIVNHRR
jgi:hypothetical protein